MDIKSTDPQSDNVAIFVARVDPLAMVIESMEQCGE